MTALIAKERASKQLGDENGDASMIMRHRESTQPGNLIRYLALHALVGVAIGCAAAGGLLLTDAGGLATLFAESGTPLAAGALLFGGFALTFGSLAMGGAIMLLPEKG